MNFVRFESKRTARGCYLQDQLTKALRGRKQTATAVSTKHNSICIVKLQCQLRVIRKRVKLRGKLQARQAARAHYCRRHYLEVMHRFLPPGGTTDDHMADRLYFDKKIV